MFFKSSAPGGHDDYFNEIARGTQIVEREAFGICDDRIVKKYDIVQLNATETKSLLSLNVTLPMT